MQFESERFSGWATDARLRRSMKACLANSCLEAGEGSVQLSRSDKFWAIYWYKLWQTCPTELAQGHLSAYLQEVCYWATQKTLTRFTITQYTFSDCFQVAITRLDKVLKRFDPTYGSDLKTYASVAFSRLIQDFLKQQQIMDI
ncbi:MAG TPA: sigma-70 family RNA polymerase sigma factor, partial [Coleofasciculaceae cyanobacterium]